MFKVHLLSNNNNKLRKETVLPPSGSNTETLGTGGTPLSSSTADPKTRLSEIKNEVKGLQGQIKTLQREEKGIKSAQAKSKASAKKKNKSGKK